MAQSWIDEDAPGRADPLVTDILLRDTAQALGEVVFSLNSVLSSVQRCFSMDAAPNPKFRELRGRVTESIVLYRDLHQPLSSKVVSDLKQIFAFYDVWDPESFKDNIQEIADVVNERTQNAKLASQYDMRMLEQLNSQQQEALRVIQLLTRDHEAGMLKVEELQQKGSSVKKKVHTEEKPPAGWRWAHEIRKLGLVKGSHHSADHRTLNDAKKCSTDHGLKSQVSIEEDIVRAISTKEQAHMALSAANMIENTLLPALQRFTGASEQVTRFFLALDKEVSHFAKCAIDSKTNLQRMASHFKNMQNGGKSIRQSCDKYIASEPGVLAEIQNLSIHLQHGNNEANFIQQWLDKKLEHKRPPGVVETHLSRELKFENVKQLLSPDAVKMQLPHVVAYEQHKRPPSPGVVEIHIPGEVTVEQKGPASPGVVEIHIPGEVTVEQKGTPSPRVAQVQLPSSVSSTEQFPQNL